MTDSPREFEPREGHLYVRCHGPFNAENNLAHLRAALDECLRLDLRRVLFDVTAEVGALSFLSRYYIGDEAADFWDPRVRIVVLAREEQIDKDRIAVKVARNRGVPAQILSDPDEALKLLFE